MLKKKVWQYQCEFCGKKNYSASHMNKHEKRCTMNPERECGMCLMNDELNNLNDLKMLISDPEYIEEHGHETLMNSDKLKGDLEFLRQESNNCPACILAVLRQNNIHPASVDFDFKKECESFWEDWNDYHNKQSISGYPASL